MNNNAHLFLSYKHEDQSRIEALVHALEAEELTVWWNRRIPTGSSWREQITLHLDTAAAVIVVWSETSVTGAGEFVHEEASRARRFGTYLGIRIDPVEPPLGFGECQLIDFSEWQGGRDEPCFQYLLAGCRAMVNDHRLKPVASGYG
ncbi:MAG: hypothetical protein Tsb002_34240 [Wenzhouxiangellaceae bacterium]